MKDRRCLSKQVIPRWRIGASNCYTFSHVKRNLVVVPVLHIYGSQSSSNKKLSQILSPLHSFMAGHAPAY